MPDLVWDEDDGYSQKPSPAYGTDVNTKLLDILNDYSARETTYTQRKYSWFSTHNQPKPSKKCPGG